MCIILFDPCWVSSETICNVDIQGLFDEFKMRQDLSLVLTEDTPLDQGWLIKLVLC